MKIRLDKLLLERGLAASRERAQALILAGKVLVNGQKMEKAGTSVDAAAELRLLGEDLKFVSRGGLKLERALEHWHMDVNSNVCLDVGASTGGFTDCLLQRGAARVIAVDTGYGQLSFRLRQDARVRLLEKTNARYLTGEQIGENVDLVVMDVSFISATLVLPAVMAAAFPKDGSWENKRIIVLVKPQFEVGREQVGKGGIVRDAALQAAAVEKVRHSLVSLGCSHTDVIESPILGAEGNREFLLYAASSAGSSSASKGDLLDFLYNLKLTMAANLVTETKSVAIVSKPSKPELSGIVPELLEWFQQRQYRVVMDQETAKFALGREVVSRAELALHSLNFVVVLGGDGTLLSAARAVAKAGIPVLGVNLGSLGFLTEVPLEEMYATLQHIDEGRCMVETRSMVHCDVIRHDACIASYDAVNDVVVGKGTIARLNHCDVYIDRIFVSSYQADSLIVSTPTGSTAYSLAAGGPILMPSVEAFVITPVSAHSLTHRPLVVRDVAEIEIVAKTGSDEAYLSVDGQLGMPIQDGDHLLCRKSALQVRLFRTQGTFFDVLRAKLKWGQR